MHSQRVTTFVTPPQIMLSRKASGICGRREASARLILSLPDSRLYRKTDRKADTKPALSKKRDQR
jgi:hypothetical protein